MSHRLLSSSTLLLLLASHLAHAQDKGRAQVVHGRPLGVAFGVSGRVGLAPTDPRHLAASMASRLREVE